MDNVIPMVAFFPFALLIYRSGENGEMKTRVGFIMINLFGRNCRRTL